MWPMVAPSVLVCVNISVDRRLVEYKAVCDHLIFDYHNHNNRLYYLSSLFALFA